MKQLEAIVLPWPDWNVTKKLGSGGFGSVYEIEKTVLGHTEKSALKIISIPKDDEALEEDYGEGYDDDSLALKYKLELEALMKEYQFMYEFRGESTIVNCEDIATMQQDNGIGWNLYIRMELLRPLVSILKVNSLTEEEVLKLGIDICTALVLCEQKNVIHRDIKPENIMVSPLGRYKLGDFGIARTMDHATQATRIGTIRYMAPEVVRGKKYGFEVDIYSLGLVMYWLLNCRRMPFLPTDRVPTPDEVTEAQAKRVAGIELLPPCEGSKELQQIILRACAFVPENRYGSAKEMLEALKLVYKQGKYSPAAKKTMNRNASKDKQVSATIVMNSEVTVPMEGLLEETILESQIPETSFVSQVPETSFGDPISETTMWTPDHEPKKPTRKAGLLIGLFAVVLLIVIVLVYAVNRKSDDGQDVTQVEQAQTEGTAETMEEEDSEGIVDLTEAQQPEMVETQVGDIVSFGSYEQDNDLSNGQEAIDWIVLDKKDGQLLLVSKYILDAHSYNDGNESVTWESSDIRNWLNGEFLNTAFGTMEMEAIKTTDVKAADNPKYDVAAGNDTTDKIFLLSCAEAEMYFGTEIPLAADPTIYAIENGVYELDNNTYSRWWLRSLGRQGEFVTYVDDTIWYFGDYMDFDNYGIRPALWVQEDLITAVE